uniref:Putative vegetative cell wall protein gp1 n=1 Tax=Amblyomma aureolatum TaxID=187763 RepID=A0A1E1X6J6_9ACAR
MGVPRQKVVVGVPMFGMTYRLADPNVATVGAPLYHGHDDAYQFNHPQFCALQHNLNFTVARDADLTAPYAVSGDAFMGFEDELSLRLKGKYVQVQDLGGVYAYAVNDDDTRAVCGQGQFPLLHSLHEGITGGLHAAGGQLDYVATNTETRIVRIVDQTGHNLHVDGLNSYSVAGFTCTRAGSYRHPEDCSKFFRCVKYDQRKHEYTVFIFDCPPGLVFDEKIEVCNWPSWSESCHGSGEIATTPKSAFRCPGLGYYQDPDNCRWFYFCDDAYENGTLMAFDMRCPHGLGFDPNTFSCNYQAVTPGCKGHSGVVQQALFGPSLFSPGEFYNRPAGPAAIHGAVPLLPGHVQRPQPLGLHGVSVPTGVIPTEIHLSAPLPQQRIHPLVKKSAFHRPSHVQTRDIPTQYLPAAYQGPLGSHYPEIQIEARLIQSPDLQGQGVYYGQQVYGQPQGYDQGPHIPKTTGGYGALQVTVPQGTHSPVLQHPAGAGLYGQDGSYGTAGQLQPGTYRVPAVNLPPPPAPPPKFQVPGVQYGPPEVHRNFDHTLSNLYRHHIVHGPGSSAAFIPGPPQLPQYYRPFQELPRQLSYPPQLDSGLRTLSGPYNSFMRYNPATSFYGGYAGTYERKAFSPPLVRPSSRIRYETLPPAPQFQTGPQDDSYFQTQKTQVGSNSFLFGNTEPQNPRYDGLTQVVRTRLPFGTANVYLFNPLTYMNTNFRQGMTMFGSNYLYGDSHHMFPLSPPDPPKPTVPTLPVTRPLSYVPKPPETRTVPPFTIGGPGTQYTYTTPPPPLRRDDDELISLDALTNTRSRPLVPAAPTPLGQPPLSQQFPKYNAPTYPSPPSFQLPPVQPQKPSFSFSPGQNLGPGRKFQPPLPTPTILPTGPAPTFAALAPKPPAPTVPVLRPIPPTIPAQTRRPAPPPPPPRPPPPTPPRATYTIPISQPPTPTASAFSSPVAPALPPAPIPTKPTENLPPLPPPPPSLPPSPLPSLPPSPLPSLPPLPPTATTAVSKPVAKYSVNKLVVEERDPLITNVKPILHTAPLDEPPQSIIEELQKVLGRMRPGSYANPVITPIEQLLEEEDDPAVKLIATDKGPPELPHAGSRLLSKPALPVEILDPQLLAHKVQKPLSAQQSEAIVADSPPPDKSSVFLKGKTLVENIQATNKVPADGLQQELKDKASKMSTIPEVACTRVGLFRHPTDCSRFYECYYDKWLQKYTVHEFECPIKLAFDSSVSACSSEGYEKLCSKKSAAAA